MRHGRPCPTAKGRVLLAGDAAHIHHSVGGQGLNIGVQDAVNLGWKLAQVVKGLSPDSLLDSYHAERHPVGARTLRNTMAQIALLRRGEDGLKAAREVVAELLAMDAPRQRFGAMMSGLDVHYDLGQGHALLGRRMPDLDLVVDGRPLRLFTLLYGARGLLLILGRPAASTSRPGQIASISSKRTITVHGSFRPLDKSRRQKPCWCGLTGMWPGWETRANTDLRRR